MKAYHWLVVLAVVASSPRHALFALTPLSAKSMQAKVYIGSGVEFHPTGDPSRFSVSSALATLSSYPRDSYLQNVVSMDVNSIPDTNEIGGENDNNIVDTDNSLQLHWDDPGTFTSFSLQAVVKTRNEIVPVRTKIRFPIWGVTTTNPELVPYLKRGAACDQSNTLMELAETLVAGKDDLYHAVFTLADWVTTNIEYSLASEGKDNIQTATEVLRSRRGKCDELTALFVSLNRAVGIPARFVTGYAYTNHPELLDDEWGGHEWAEVWFPVVGWVPFDVTYGEYGYLSAGHIMLNVSEDAKGTFVDYTARGTEFKLVTEPMLDTEVTPEDMQETGSVAPRVDTRLDSSHQEAEVGSTLALFATVVNNEDYYVSTRLELAKTADTTLLTGQAKTNLLLNPREVRTISYTVQIDPNLKRGYTYGFPFALTSSFGNESKLSVTVKGDNPREKFVTSTGGGPPGAMYGYPQKRIGTAPPPRQGWLIE